MAKIPYAPPKGDSMLAQPTTRESALARIVESYRRKVKQVFPLAQFDTQFTLDVTVHLWADELESKFGPSMTWENYGKWTVGAVTPMKRYKLDTPDGFYGYFHHSNFIPKWRQKSGFVANPDKPSPVDRYAEEI